MLRGSIDVQSEVGQGTVVTVRLPLSRMPGTDTPVTTPSSDPSIDGGSQDDSIRVLQADYQTTTVCLYAFDHPGYTAGATEAGQAIKHYLENWFGLETSSLSYLTLTDLIVVDEKDFANSVTDNTSGLPTVVLCSYSTRSQTASLQKTPAVVEFVSKPFGPRKLAKALRSCLDKAREFSLGLTPVIRFSGQESSLDSKADTAIPELEHLTLETDDEMRPLSVLSNGVVTASESTNAQMAIDSCSSSNGTSGEVTVTDAQDFPFPDQDSVEEEVKSPESPRGTSWRSLGDLTRQDSRRPPLLSRMTEPSYKTPFPDSLAVTKHGEMATFEVDPPPTETAAAKANFLNENNRTSLTASNMALHNQTEPIEPLQAQSPAREKRPPRLLLVDDNKINLRLLETYMRKRKYNDVDSAENGQQAVQAAEAHGKGYDIIFMGKSSTNNAEHYLI